MPGANKVAQDFAKRIKSVQLSNNHEVTDLHTEGSLNYEVLRHLLDKLVRPLHGHCLFCTLSSPISWSNLMFCLDSALLHPKILGESQLSST